LEKSAVAEHSINLGHHIQIHDIIILIMKSGNTEHIIREVTKSELHPDKYTGKKVSPRAGHGSLSFKP
jgi:hypothetical protein